MRRLVSARTRLTERLAKASGEEAAIVQKQLRAITNAFQPLQGLFELLQEADVKPNAALEAAVKEALNRANAALAALTT